jgi:hypothetical protein
MVQYHRQLDLFRIQVPPCGRSSAPFCEREHTPATGPLTCLYCGCIAPGVTMPSSR